MNATNNNIIILPGMDDMNQLHQEMRLPLREDGLGVL